MHGAMNVISLLAHLRARASQYTTAFHLHSLDSAELQCVCVPRETENWLRRGCVEILWSVPLFNFYTMPDDGLTMNGNHVLYLFTYV